MTRKLARTDKSGISPSAIVLSTIGGGLLLLLAVAFITSIPDLRRYMKIRSM